MALPNMIKVGDRVTFGRAGEKKRTGIVKKKSPKTARIAVPGDGGWNVSYNFMQKVGGAKKAPVKRKAPATKRKTAKRSPIGRRYTKAPRAPAKVIQYPHSNAHARKAGRNWEFYDDYGDQVWVGPLSQLDINDLSDALGSTEAAYYLAYAAQGAKRNPAPNRKAPPKHNPANLTKKGERAYKHIKKGYGSDPRAKEIAARTVYTMAKTTPGLVRKTSRPPGVSLRGNPRKKLTAAQRRKVEAHFASIDTPFSASFIRSFTNTPEFKAASVVNRKEFLKLFDLTPTQMKKYLKR